MNLVVCYSEWAIVELCLGLNMGQLKRSKCIFIHVANSIKFRRKEQKDLLFYSKYVPLHF